MKQESLEEAALRLYPKLISDPYNPSEDLLEEERSIFIAGAKLQEDSNKYSKADMISFAHFYFTEEFNSSMQTSKSTEEIFEDWMEQSLNK